MSKFQRRDFLSGAAAFGRRRGGHFGSDEGG